MLSSHSKVSSSCTTGTSVSAASTIVNGFPTTFDLMSVTDAISIRDASVQKRRPPSLAILPYTDVDGEPRGAGHALSFLNYVTRRVVIKEVENCFSGRDVIDLGAGRDFHGYQLCQKLGARSYVGIEHCFGVELVRDLSATQLQIPAAVVFADMLQVLRECKELDVSFLVSAIDTSIMPSHYLRSVSQEIARLLTGSNVCLTLFSPDVNPPNCPIVFSKEIPLCEVFLYGPTKSL